ncbi:MAG: GGDEF domain-containing protein [Firmicutes bacterium]|nr:GGDEF domain-containing protein [Bacillota bacterium]
MSEGKEFYEARRNIEESYSNLRETFKLMFSDVWHNYARSYPSAQSFDMKSLIKVTLELSNIIGQKVLIDHMGVKSNGEKAEDVIKKQKLAIFEKNNEISKRDKLIVDLSSSNILKDNEIRKQNATMQELFKDAVTGLGTRNYYDVRLRAETFETLQAHSFTAIVLDVNKLKVLNDTHGHVVGDEYLKTLGDSISSSLHADDAAYRMGGDEFLIVPRISVHQALTMLSNAGMNEIPKTKPEIIMKAAEIVAQRVSNRFQKMWNNRFGVTSGFSYGIATLDEPEVKKLIAAESKLILEDGRGITIPDMIGVVYDLADQRQYKHKQKLRKPSGCEQVKREQKNQTSLDDLRIDYIL